MQSIHNCIFLGKNVDCFMRIEASGVSIDSVSMFDISKHSFLQRLKVCFKVCKFILSTDKVI